MYFVFKHVQFYKMLCILLFIFRVYLRISYVI